MFQFIGAVILFIISVVASYVCPEPVRGGKSSSWAPAHAAQTIWFDPKKFAQFQPWHMGAGAAPSKWDAIATTKNQEWQKMLAAHDKNGICFATDNLVMQWQPYNALPHARDTQYLRDYKCTLDTLKGNDGFLMNPFLREWQNKHVPQHITDRAHIFDIGIGTGRSKELWQAKNATVWGVEPHLPNFENLMRKRIPQLRDAKNWGGEDTQILMWIPREEMDVVMMCYSITFFFENPEKLSHLMRNIDCALTPGGKFIIIGMDGAVVDGWFKNTKEIDNSCFKITKKYDKLSTFGSEIEITMKNPFTLVEAQREFIVDFDELERQFKSLKYKCLQKENVVPPYFLSEWSAKFASAQRFMVFEKPPKN